MTMTPPPEPLALLRAAHRRGLLMPVLREAAAELACVAEARRLGVSADPAALQAAADAFRRRHGLHSSEATRAWLAGRGLSVAGLQEVLEADTLVEALRAHLVRELGSVALARDPARYERRLLSAVDAASEGEARELLLRMEDEGVDFAALPGRRDLGVACRGELPEGHAAAVFACRQGGVAGPLLSASGWRLYHVEGELPADPSGTLLARDVFGAWVTARLDESPPAMGWLDGTG